MYKCLPMSIKIDNSPKFLSSLSLRVKKSTMAPKFHFFPLLPWELREKIWKLAIRPTVPGANFFRAYRNQPGPVPEHEACTDGDIDRCMWWCLAAPQCLPNNVDFSPAARRAAPISWTLNNPSPTLSTVVFGPHVKNQC